MTYFSDLGLAEPLLRALGTKGYADPTPIQRQSIPALLEGRDLLGIAQTGTGKTAAFSLPSLHRLAADPKPRKPASCRMLVLSPTRELAAQIAENMRGYAKYLQISVQCVFGGVPASKQARMLVQGCDVLVATPGRLLDLIEQRALTLRNVEIFVLDEADQMMDLGFINPLKRIAAMLPKERQSLFFSATMPKAIADLGKQFIQNPVRVEVTPQATTAERVEQYATFLNQAEKQALLTLRLRAGLADGSIDRALVFSRTKHGADRVVRHLATAGVRSAAIHGNKSQAQRTAAIRGFKTGDVPVLVATDIAARGIDIPGVSHVFNFEMPNVAEQYVHRIGRTARAGADGIAMSFVAPDEKAYLRDIEKLTGVKLVPMPLPADFMTEAARLPLPSRKAVQDAVAEGDGNRHRARGQRSDRTGGRAPARTGDRRPRHDDRQSADRPREEHRAQGGRFEGRSDDTRRSDGRRDFARHADGDRPASPPAKKYAARPADPRQQANGDKRRAAAGHGSQDRDGQGRASQGRSGQDRSGPDRSGHDRSGQQRNGQTRNGQSRSAQGHGGGQRSGHSRGDQGSSRQSGGYRG